MKSYRSLRVCFPHADGLQHSFKCVGHMMFVTSLLCLFTQLHPICTTEDLTNKMWILGI